MLKIKERYKFIRYSRFYFKKSKNKFKKFFDRFRLISFFLNLNIKNYIIRTNNTTYYLIYNKYFFYKIPNNNLKGFTSKLNFFNRYKSIYSIYRYFFIKIKFYGKSFRWTFTKKKIRFRVQKAHRTYIFIKNLKFKKKRKFKFKLRIYILSDKKVYQNHLKKIKPIDIYTKKGLRVLKTVFNKKKGKISTYM